MPMTVKERTMVVNNLKYEIIGHCMCFVFSEDKYRYRVLTPEGYFPDLIQVDKDIGKAKALKKLLDAIETVWIESYP